MVRRAGVTLMLSQVDAPAAVRPNAAAEGGDAWDAYVWVEDADALCAEFRAKGVTIVREICEHRTAVATST